MKESDIQKAIIEYLSFRKDVYFIRNNNFAGAFVRSNGSKGYVRNLKAGSPDIVVLYNGNWIGLEVKTEEGRQSELQLQAEQDIKNCGGIYAVVHDIGEVEMILNKLSTFGDKRGT